MPGRRPKAKSGEPPTLDSLIKKNPEHWKLLQAARKETNSGLKAASASTSGGSSRSVSGTRAKKREMPQSPEAKPRARAKRQRQLPDYPAESSDEGPGLSDAAGDDSGDDYQRESGDEAMGDIEEDLIASLGKGKGRAAPKKAGARRASGRVARSDFDVKAIVLLPEGREFYAKTSAKREKKPQWDKITELRSQGLAVISASRGDLGVSRSWSDEEGRQAIHSHFSRVVDLIRPLAAPDSPIIPVKSNRGLLELVKSMDGESFIKRCGERTTWGERLLFFTTSVPVDLDVLASAHDSSQAVLESGPSAGRSKPSLAVRGSAGLMAEKSTAGRSRKPAEVIELPSDSEGAATEPEDHDGIGEISNHLSNSFLSTIPASAPAPASASALSPPAPLPTATDFPSSSSAASSTAATQQYRDPLARYREIASRARAGSWIVV